MAYDTNAAEYLRTQVINISTSGDNTLISAPTTTGNYLAIDFMLFLPTTAVSITLYDGTSAETQTALSGPLPMDAKQAVVAENAIQNVRGVITLSPNKSFVMNLGDAVQVGGWIRFREVGN